MELLFQGWDEVDDMLAACMHLLARYGTAEVLVIASAAFGAIRRPRRAADATRRRSLRMRAA